ncbi:sterol desaturase family protein [Halovivax asiaticus JCM 14624]|uniref:Sterol desaturase family protein n=1 Tax=Halovivax asiaticus JCM 14624 TaxID=1227490 RepID=M0BHV7_9EURY|nr:hypothetical protein [Halovivax asiaticus]ELZ09239.1 sterol desaturase family protein [Halovivax asiaticus JCM 14624]
MDRSTRDTLVSIFVGGGVGAGLYWIAGYESLALVTGLCWACGLKLTLHVGHRYPAFATGESWTDKRWTGLSVGAVTGAALVGVSPLLPLSNDLRFGLGALVLGAGLVAYPAGSLAVLERVDGATDSASMNSGTPSPSDTE